MQASGKSCAGAVALHSVESWRWRDGGKSPEAIIGRLLFERQQQVRIAAVQQFTGKKILGDKSERQLLENRYSP